MREILFRGKHANPYDTEDWYYGYYKRTNNVYHYIIKENGNIIPINSKTLGQFTGLRDKNGIKIFEGDIIKQYDDISKVYWDEDACKFLIRCYNTGLPTNLVLPCALHSSCTYEVIGNIYDNPELLKGVKE